MKVIALQARERALQPNQTNARRMKAFLVHQFPHCSLIQLWPRNLIHNTSHRGLGIPGRHLHQWCQRVTSGVHSCMGWWVSRVAWGCHQQCHTGSPAGLASLLAVELLLCSATAHHAYLALSTLFFCRWYWGKPWEGTWGRELIFPCFTALGHPSSPLLPHLLDAFWLRQEFPHPYSKEKSSTTRYLWC